MDVAKLFDLTGKTALVTGSSDGLGLAMARGLAGAGATLVLNGRNESKLAAAAKSFEAAGHRVSARAFDVADEAAVSAAFEHFDAEGLAIDILVNNAGNQLRKPMVDVTTSEWRRDPGNASHRRVSGRPRGGPADDRARTRRQDHQHRLARERRRSQDHCALHRRQRRHKNADPVDGGRMGRARHPGQRHRAGIYRHRNDKAVDERREVRRLGEGPHALGALGQRRTISSASRCSSHRPPRTT